MVFFIAWVSSAILLSQDEETVKETLAVINVEVPVRVFMDGKPVLDLKKEDFTVYEDGKPQAINGFQLVSKRIASGWKARPGPSCRLPAISCWRSGSSISTIRCKTDWHMFLAKYCGRRPVAGIYQR